MICEKADGSSAAGVLAALLAAEVCGLWTGDCVEILNVAEAKGGDLALRSADHLQTPDHPCGPLFLLIFRRPRRAPPAQRAVQDLPVRQKLPCGGRP